MSTQIREGQFAGVMPDMSDEEYETLKESIRENGFDETQPIVVDGDGVIVDGHHRYRACTELGVEPKVVTKDDVTTEYAYRRNLARRDLDGKQKKEVVADYLEDHYHGDRTQSEIADDLGVTQPTVSRAFKEVESTDEDSIPQNNVQPEERQEMIQECIKEHPDASNSEVADMVKCQASRETVRRIRKKTEKSESVDESEEDDIASDGSTGEDQWPQTCNVRVWARAGGKQVDVDGDVPPAALEKYPDEKKSDNPLNTFLRDLASTVATEIGATLDDLEPGDRVGTITFAETGGWSFDPLGGLEEGANSETHDSSAERTATAGESDTDDAQDTGAKKPDTDDPAASEQPHPSDEADTPLQQALVKVDQLKEEKQQLQKQLEECREGRLEVAEITPEIKKARKHVGFAKTYLEGEPDVRSAQDKIENIESILEGLS